MAAGLSAAISTRPFRLVETYNLFNKPSLTFSPFRHTTRLFNRTKTSTFTVCLVVEEKKKLSPQIEIAADETETQIAAARLAEKIERKRSERLTYLIAAVMSSFGVTSMGIMAVYYRFAWQMEVQFVL